MTRDDPMELAMLAELNPVAAHLFAHLEQPMRPDVELIPGRDDFDEGEDESHV